MGFPPAEVAAGMRELLAARGLAAAAAENSGTWTFRVGELTITVGPLPAGRSVAALFQPRTLLVLTGAGPLAASLKDAIRRKFLRVTG